MKAWVGVAFGVPPPSAGMLATTRLSHAAKNSRAPMAQTVCASAGITAPAERRASSASSIDAGLEEVRDLISKEADGAKALVEHDHPEDGHREDEAQRR